MDADTLKTLILETVQAFLETHPVLDEKFPNIAMDFSGPNEHGEDAPLIVTVGGFTAYVVVTVFDDE